MVDPDATLRDLRDAVTQWRDAVKQGLGDAEREAAQPAVEAAAALDGWLSRGRVLPAAWAMRPGARVKRRGGDEVGEVSELFCDGQIARVRWPGHRKAGTSDIGTVVLEIVQPEQRVSTRPDGTPGDPPNVRHVISATVLVDQGRYRRALMCWHPTGNPNAHVDYDEAVKAGHLVGNSVTSERLHRESGMCVECVRRFDEQHPGGAL